MAGNTAGTGGPAGTGDAAGTGGPAGTAGTGAVVPPPGFESSPPATDCSVTPTPPGLHLIDDQTLTCDTSIDKVRLAPGRGSVVQVVAGRVEQGRAYARLFSLPGAQSAARVEAPTGGLWDATLLVDSMGGVHLAGRRDQGDVHELAYYTRDNPGWRRETIPPVAGETPGASVMVDAALGPEDRAFFLISGGTAARVATRAATGVFTSDPLLGFDSPVRGLVDAAGHFQMLYLADVGSGALVQRELGGTNPKILASATGYDGAVAAVALADGRVVSSIKTTAAITVVIPQGDLDPMRIPLADTQKLVAIGCGPGRVSPTPQQTGKCTETGKGTLGQHALAETDDGSLWLAYVDSNIDRDATVNCVPFEGQAYSCTKTVTAERSKTELVLVRVSSKAKPFMPSIVWRAPVDNDFSQYGPQVAMAAQGTRLALVFSRKATPLVGTTQALRYVVLFTPDL
jgi:hypothetical protein